MENTGEKSLKVVENNVATKGKKIYIEVLRCIAIFFVIFNHTEEYGFDLYKETAETWPYIIYLTISILCKAAVPIFFMISGGLNSIICIWLAKIRIKFNFALAKECLMGRYLYIPIIAAIFLSSCFVRLE